MKKHVVLVDDDMFIRDLVGTKLGSSKDYTVAVAASAAEGMEAIEDQRPDVLILDIEMPGKTGIELLKDIKMRPSLADIPVIMFSNNDDEESKTAAMESGAKKFCVKVSIDMSELEEIIGSVLEETEA